MGTFVDQIEAFIAKAEKRAEAVRIGASQDVAEEVIRPVAKGGHMRVDTGFLRASFIGALDAMPGIVETYRPPADAAKDSFPDQIGQISLIIAQAKDGQPVYMGFTAAYARPREYKDGFVRLAAQRWASIVYENALKAIQAFP